MAPRITGGPSSHGVVYRQSIPRIASVSPSSGPAGGGTLVTISGSGFQSGAAVTMGGSLAGAVIGPSAITASSPPLSAGSLNDVLVTNPDTTLALYENAWLADFRDVPQSARLPRLHRVAHPPRDHRRAAATATVPNGSVTRAQMAVFLLKAEHGRGLRPARLQAESSPDVPCPSPLRRLDRAALQRGDHGGLRHRPVLPRTTP